MMYEDRPCADVGFVSPVAAPLLYDQSLCDATFPPIKAAN